VEPVRPDYRGASLVGLIPALLSDRPLPPWFPDLVRDARSVVLLVLDGLGWNLLQAHAQRAPTLSSLAGAPITTVVPSTTGAALTSITTGVAPAEHGIVGYRMRAGTHVLDVLRWQTGDGRPPTPSSMAPVAPFRGKRVPLVTRGEFAKTGFTEAHMRGGRVVGWRTTATLVQHCRRLAVAGERLVYAYYDGVDRVAHEFGLHDEYMPAEIASTDALVRDLIDALPSDAAVLITSDHGQVQYDNVVALNSVESLIDAYAGDGRFRYLYARPGAAPDLHKRALEEFADMAWVFARDELFDDGWFGPNPPDPAVRRRVGDVVLAARTNIAFRDPTHPGEAALRAGHGSLTPDEMLVPLLSARGRA